MCMGTIVRRNERSWAIVIISEIRAMLKGMNLKIKSAGGESTLSVNKKSMFPDVLLYEDEAQNRILQGWELKMPDVLITDEALIKDATRKAIALDLNSFVIWNFTYGKLYIKSVNGDFEEAKVWSGTNHIKSREDVTTYKAEWMPIIRDIVLTVNEFLVNGVISASSIETTISDGLMTEIILRNKDLVAENLILEVSSDMTMESRLKIWWNAFHEEYDKDENDMYSAYAKSILLNWTNRIMFANTIKKYHNCAYGIDRIDSTSTPSDGNAIIDEIVEQGDFYNVFKRLEYNEIVPEDTWIDIVDYNQFLVENRIEKINQAVLQEILEKTVNTAKREIRGQYATPYCLADLLCQITIHNWNDECADLCAGTGTIARAIIKNKTERLHNSEAAFTTMWIADKYAYPLQIANIAVTNMEALNIPLNIFQSDIFAVKSGDKIEIKSPIDGSGIEKEIAKPNLSSKINFWMLNKEIEKLNSHEKETIVNSIVLGEEIDRTVVSVKKYSIDMIKKITDKGITLNALFHDVSWVEKLAECLIPIEKILTVKRGERRGWNDLFYPSENSGIESEYIKPVLKNPALLKSYTAQTDIVAFCCHKSKDELRQLGHIGALNWIEKFENIRNGTGKLLSEALKRSGSFWYEMDDATKADFVTALNPDKRLFVAKFDESTFVDQRFTRMLMKNTNLSKDLLHALLNSLFGMFAIEAIGFGRGLGVLDASSTKLKNMYMINPQIISETDTLEIVELFNKIKNRNVMDTEDELKDSDREIFDRKVLRAIGHEELYDAIKESLLSMQYTRHTVK